MQWEMCSVKCAVFCVKVQCAVCSANRAICDEKCAVQCMHSTLDYLVYSAVF